MRLIRTLPLLLVFLLVAACASGPPAPDAMSDLELTWYKAETALPSALGGGMERMSDPARREALQNAPRKFPVVLYLHGCTGMSGEDRDLMEALARAGYVVIGPDSMARRFRPLQCSSWSKDGGFNLFVFDFRQAEINFALQQMAGSKWADWDNLFVVGVSEGGLAAAHFRGDVFRARVITQWTCHGSTWVRGIDGPSDTPVLSVVRKDDPWYTKEGSTQSGDCGAYFGDNRPGSRSMVLDKGSDHAVMGDKSVVSAIVSFLDANRR